MFTSLSLSLISGLVFFSGILTLILGLLSSRKGNSNGEFIFSLLMVACSFYSLGYSLELTATNLKLMINALNFQYLGAVFISPLMLLFTLKYTGRFSIITKNFIGGLMAVPVLILFFMLTNEYHQLFYTSFAIDKTDYFSTLNSEKGFIYWIHQFYSISLSVLSFGLLLTIYNDISPNLKKQVLFVLLGLFFPLATYIIYLSNLIPNHLDPIPLSFSLTGIFIYIGLFGFELFKIVPIAYKNLFENLSGAVLVTDLTGKILISTNSSAQKMLGINLEKQQFDINTYLQDWPELINLILDSNSASTIEFSKNDDKEKNWYSASKSSISDNSGNILGKLVFIQNINQQKKHELELIQARQEAIHANNAKSEFLANMSHEIRTPLNGVIGFTDLLAQTTLDKTQKLYLENAERSAQSLLNIINDILDFSKIEAGKLELEFVKTDLIQLIEDTVDIIKLQADQKNIEFVLSLDTNIPEYVTLDPIRVKQILINLLANAVKFTRVGEVVFNVNFSELDSKIGIIHFSIKDTGIGISSEHQKKLFTSFSQADSSTTRKYGGTGLGLTISSMLVKKMNSSIELVSELDKGSVFSFDISVEYLKSDTSIFDLKPNKIKKVLLVDDNKASKIVLNRYLTKIGIDCTLAENGMQVINYLNKGNRYDALFIDFQMPELNGLETISIIRNQLQLSPKKLPIVLLQGSTTSTDLNKQIFELGINNTLIKPIKLTDFFQTIGQLKNIKGTERSENVLSEPYLKSTSTELESKEYKPTVLIVEDVKTNMLLLQNYLKQWVESCVIVEATNGKMAIQKYIECLPDLVIMDIQMPEMDGLEATKAIRKLERSTDRKVPIIALTAGTLKEEKQKCFEAGMNAYLQKPIMFNQLIQELNKWSLNSASSSINLYETKSELVDSSFSTYTSTKFDHLKLFQKVGGDKELYIQIIHSLLNEIPNYLNELELAISNLNFKPIKKIAHTIKGTTANVFITDLVSISNELEQTKTIEEAKLVFDRLKENWKTIEIELKKSISIV